MCRTAAQLPVFLAHLRCHEDVVDAHPHGPPDHHSSSRRDRSQLVRIRLIRFITFGKDAGTSALGIVESRPRLHGQSQGSLPLMPIDRSRVEHTSCEAVSDRLPIPSGSRLARALPNPLTAWRLANSLLSSGRSPPLEGTRSTEFHPRRRESSNPPTSSLPPSSMRQPAAPGRPQHDGSPSLVVSHDDSCSPFVRREQTTPPVWAVASYPPSPAQLFVQCCSR